MQLVPVGTDVGIVGNLVIVHPLFTLLDESVLLVVGSDAGCSQEGLLEVRVDRRTRDRLQTLQLTRGGHIETLKKSRSNFSLFLGKKFMHYLNKEVEYGQWNDDNGESGCGNDNHDKCTDNT